MNSKLQTDAQTEPAQAGSVQRIVRPRIIRLSENVRQENPVGFMVFAHKDIDADYYIFPDYQEAQTYAMEQEEKSNVAEDSWPIYALWASEWPNAPGERPGATTKKETNAN